MTHPRKILWFATALLLCALNVVAHPDTPSLAVITKASIDYNAGTVTLSGSGFGALPTVKLASATLTTRTASSTQIVAAFPATTPLSSFAAGDYLVIVTFQSSGALIFTVTLGAIGPSGLPGPPGPKGDTGATGATGAQGPKGDTGAAGGAATIVVGTVMNGAPGSNATVLNSGTPSAAVLNFVIPEGAKGDKGDKGDTGGTGPTGATGPQGPPGPTGVGAGFSGMQEFTNPGNNPSATYTWTAPAGITHVMVEMWGGGTGGGIFGGFGGSYARSVVGVVPGTVYTIAVGGGGSGNLIAESGDEGYASSMSLAGITLISASGNPDPNAVIYRFGNFTSLSFTGNTAFGASFCPGPLGDHTGRGGDANSPGQPGYVLLTW